MSATQDLRHMSNTTTASEDQIATTASDDQILTNATTSSAENDNITSVVVSESTKDSYQPYQENEKHKDDPQINKEILQRSSLREKILNIMISCIGEIFGTFLLTLIICTVVAAAVMSEAQQGIWQVAIPSGLGVAISIFLSAHISDAHLNPAVTLAFGIVRFRQFHWSYIIPYILSQFFGAFIAGTFVYAFYHGAISNFEDINNITRGEIGSELSAMTFGEYFPNPALYDHSINLEVVSIVEAFFVEAWGTLILVFVIFSITHPANTTVGENKAVIPFIVAITVACLISVYGPLTQAGLNPARDFGPRVMALLAGWKTIAIPGPRNGFWVYIFGPLVGGVIGGALSDLVFFCTKHLKKA